jgi:hypothetical protein
VGVSEGLRRHDLDRIVWRRALVTGGKLARQGGDRSEPQRRENDRRPDRGREATSGLAGEARRGRPQAASDGVWQPGEDMPDVCDEVAQATQALPKREQDVARIGDVPRGGEPEPTHRRALYRLNLNGS